MNRHGKLRLFSLDLSLFHFSSVAFYMKIEYTYILWNATTITMKEKKNQMIICLNELIFLFFCNWCDVELCVQYKDIQYDITLTSANGYNFICFPFSIHWNEVFIWLHTIIAMRRLNYNNTHRKSYSNLNNENKNKNIKKAPVKWPHKLRIEPKLFPNGNCVAAIAN